MREQEFAELLQDFLYKKFFPKREFEIIVDVLNKEEWADVSVYRKRDDKLIMQVETKIDDLAHVLGQVLWTNWETREHKVPTFLAVPYTLKGKGWGPETANKILNYYEINEIGIMIKKADDEFSIISDPLGFFKK